MQIHSDISYKEIGWVEPNGDGIGDDVSHVTPTMVASEGDSEHTLVWHSLIGGES